MLIFRPQVAALASLLTTIATACAGGVHHMQNSGDSERASATAADPNPASSAAATNAPPVVLAPRFVRFDDPHLRVVGRAIAAQGLVIGYPAVSLMFTVRSKHVAIRACSSSGNNRIGVVLDGSWVKSVRLPTGNCAEPAALPLLDGLDAGPHIVQLVHQNETWQGLVSILGIELDADAELGEPPPASPTGKRLMFIGDSVTCGEALERGPVCQKNFEWWDPYNSYGMRVGRLLGAEVNLVCYGGRGLVRDWQGKRDGFNALQLVEHTIASSAADVAAFGVQPEALTWDPKRYVPDVTVISLGTNDFNLALGPLPEKEDYVSAYVKLVTTLLDAAPDSRVILTEGSMVNDKADPKRPQKTVLRKYIAEAIRRLKTDRVTFAPATHYPGDACDAHPTTPEHAHMADDLLPYVRRALGWE
jgi:hypothetical protein